MAGSNGNGHVKNGGSLPAPPDLFGSSGGNGDVPFRQSRLRPPVGLETYAEVVANASLMRSDIWKRFLDPRRDIADECGWPKDARSWSAQNYKDLYDGHSTAARVCEVIPEECWQQSPYVWESEDAEEVTPFEADWDALPKNLSADGTHNYHQDEHGSLVYGYLRQLSVQSRIGRYGVLLYGIDDGLPLDQPARFVPPPKQDRKGRRKLPAVGLTPSPRAYDGNDPNGVYGGRYPGTNAEEEGAGEAEETKEPSHAPPPRRLLYLRVFPEALAEVTRHDTDELSPRFGQPEEYNLTFHDPDVSRQGIGAGTATRRVHWSRVLHVPAPGGGEVYGTPAMQQVLPELLDLRKVRGGSAEMLWKGGFPGIAFETNPNVTTDQALTSPVLSQLRDSMENYMNGLQRYLFIAGVTAKSLTPQVFDPTPHVGVQVNSICVRLAIPQRIFEGSERGELASGQDAKAWQDRLGGHKRYHEVPKVLAPFVNRAIALGLLTAPKGFSAGWEDVEVFTPLEQAQVLAARTGAMVQYASGGADALMAPLDYLTREMGMSEEEAQQVLESAEEHTEEKMEEQAELERQQAEEGMERDGLAADEGVERDLYAEEEKITRGLAPDPAPDFRLPGPSRNALQTSWFPVAAAFNAKGGGAGAKGGKARKPLPPGGVWRTTDDGHRIYIAGGRIAAGPKVLVGQKVRSNVPEPARKPAASPPKPGTGSEPQQKPGGPVPGPPKPTQKQEPSKESSTGKSDPGKTGKRKSDFDPETDQASPAVRAHAAASLAKMTPAEKAALVEYSKTGYSTLNPAMRQHAANPAQLPEPYKAQAAVLRGALAKAEPFSEPVRVHRWIQPTAELTSQLRSQFEALQKSGGTYQMPSFTSTTVNPKLGFIRGDSVRFDIQARTGVYLNSISNSPEDHEVLQSPDAKYKVAGVRSRTKKNGDNELVISLEEHL